MEINKSFLLLFFSLVMVSKPTFSQFEVAYADNIENLVKNQFLAKNAGIQVLSVRYAGSRAAIGTFSSKMVFNNFLSNGIILSTGNVLDAKGPNLANNKSGKNLQSGFNALSSLALANKTFDAAILAFDFTSTSDSISFRYFFASEEYPEFVNRNVNDVFAFFLIDLENGDMRNLATLPNNGAKICVDEINHLKNSEYFRLNGKWESDNLDKWKNDLKKGEMALNFEFDGFTTILNAGAKIIPQHKYRLIMAIADVGDDVYDSAIFLEANSFGANSENPLQLIFNNLEYQADNKVFIAQKNIVFDFGSAEINQPNSLVFLDSLAQVLANTNVKRIEIIGHTDSVGTESKNLLLSEKRAESVMVYLTKKGLKSNSMFVLGKGESEPISTQNQEANRRVEFRFYFE